MITVRILPTFTAEAALVGELAVIDMPTTTLKGEVTARLLGDSEYIKNNTDGHVILAPGEYELA